MAKKKTRSVTNDNSKEEAERIAQMTEEERRRECKPPMVAFIGSRTK